ncbi:MAG: hypothetical protein K8S22_03200 [Betaproteobacteria bacterium]|nr:hypothetical protein [Betaproteobacteria bacterium]
MRFSKILLLVCLAFLALAARAESTDACLSVFERAVQQQTLISSYVAGRGVVGTGRAYFHTAPDKRCQLNNVFVIPGDRLEAFTEYGEFISVIYWNARTGAGTAGWVLAARLAETGAEIASVMTPR